MSMEASRTGTAPKQMTDDLRQVATKVEDAATQQFDKFERAVRRNPVAATGIAAGVGFFLAVLARR